VRSILQLEDWFIDRFVNSFEEPSSEVTLDVDVDVHDDPTHRAQQLTLFHGYYKQYQYLVRAITCVETDMVVLPRVVRHGRPDTWSRRRFRTHRPGFA